MGRHQAPAGGAWSPLSTTRRNSPTARKDMGTVTRFFANELSQVNDHFLPDVRDRNAGLVETGLGKVGAVGVEVPEDDG